MSRPGVALTTKQLEQFLDHLRASANVTASADHTGASRRTMYRRRDSDPDFAEAWDDALETAIDMLEGEARRRALHGYEEFVTCKNGLVCDDDGNPVMQRRYSDSLMGLLLRAHRPDKYRERVNVEHSGSVDLAGLIEEGRRRARGE